ncbi:MAG: type 4a pilus biogenesis protein PilO [Deltaproteobacteria bacterium]|nr:type 4a pilus biogenesis protein PilO [Deltaproteobacteria bacterium]
MSDLVERFFDLESRQRAMLCALLLVLVAAGYWSLVYSGRLAELATTREKIQGLQDQRTTKQRLIANLDEERTAVRNLQAEVRRAEVQLPDGKEIPDLLSAISSAGRESGLEILLFRQKPERYQDFYAEVPVDVLVRGNYQQVATFFDRVGQLDRIVNVSDISMKEPKAESGTMIVNTSCSAVTFRFLDETERERIAKEKAEQAKSGKR